MRKFTFPLDKLLRIRAHQEKWARRELATAMSEVQRIDQTMNRIDGNLRTCSDAEGQGAAAAAFAGALSRGLAHTRRRLEKDRVQAEHLAEARQAAYRARRIAMKSLERLRERRHEDWRAAALREEQMELDELARLSRGVVQKREVQS